MKTRYEMDLEAWEKWKKSPTPENKKILLDRLDPILTSEVNKIAGLSPTKRKALKVRAKVLTLKALETFDPEQAQLNTYLISQLMKLKRFAYENAGIARIPENRQLKIKEYKDAVDSLDQKLLRDPSDQEISEYLGWPIIEIQKMRSQLRAEIVQSSMVYNPATKGLDDKINRKIEIIYDSLDKRDQDIFDYTLATHGKKELSNNEIALKLNVSPALVSQRKKFITQKLQDSGISRFSTESRKFMEED